MTEDIGTTPRKALSPTQRLKLFEDEGGRCCICGEKIIGKFIDEHKRALGLGGSNDLNNRGVAHPKCAAVKTRDDDMPRINKAKAQKKAQHGIKAAPVKKMQGPQFPSPPPKVRSDRTGERIPKQPLSELGPPAIARQFIERS